MDILHLVDRLEKTLNESRRLPLTANLLVDEDRVFNLIDQMRVAIPEAIKKANRVEAEKERIMAQAKEESERIRELARQEAMELVSRDAVIANAEHEADRIINQSYEKAKDIRYGADQYAVQVLAQLEEQMTRSLSIVRNGLHKLESDLGMVTDSAEPQPQQDDHVEVNVLSEDETANA